MCRAPSRPSAGPQLSLSFARAARDSEDEKQRVIGGVLGENAWRVGHREAQFFGHGQIDVIEANAEVGEESGASTPRGLECWTGQIIRQRAQHDVRVAHRSAQFVTRKLMIVRVENCVITRNQIVLDGCG